MNTEINIMWYILHDNDVIPIKHVCKTFAYWVIVIVQNTLKKMRRLSFTKKMYLRIL